MLNPLFPNHEVDTEDEILDGLIVESIQMYGRDVYYMPRTGVNNNATLNEDEFARFDTAKILEMYVESFQGFEGDGQLMAKFGLETRDMLTLTASKTRFNQVLGTLRPDGPRDGDLLYFPMTGSLWEVNYTSTRSIFYQLGQLRTYKFTLALIEYDNQVFNTGVPAIDAYNKFSTDANQTTVPDNELIANLFGDNVVLQNEAEEVLDFSNDSPLSDGPL